MSPKSERKPKQKMEIYATVSGSFRRFLPQIEEAVRELASLGIKVLSPQVSRPISQVGGFVILEKDRGSPGDIERKHLEAIPKSDFLYVVNPRGYVGESAALEIGYALSKGVPIYSSERPADEVFASFVTSSVPLARLKIRIARRKRRLAKLPLKSSPTLADLQEYVSKIVKTRGFSEEMLTDVTLLLFEEVGELAKAVRFETGLKLAKERLPSGSTVESELADCLIYLLDLANLSSVNLEQAVRAKESVNAKRKWVERHYSWNELIHRVRVKRFPQAAELLLRMRGIKPARRNTEGVADRFNVEWNHIYPMRRSAGEETIDIAEEVIANVEDWLDSLE